ncbi:MAG: ABC transporter substrate-binding protein, partial [Sedimentitalea sp.]
MVDAIIEASQRVETKEETDVTLMALDRALRHEFFMIPVWYNDVFWTAYYDMFEHPAEQPAFGLGYLDWWWHNPEKEAALKAAGALR